MHSSVPPQSPMHPNLNKVRTLRSYAPQLKASGTQRLAIILGDILRKRVASFSWPQSFWLRLFRCADTLSGRLSVFSSGVKRVLALSRTYRRGNRRYIVTAIRPSKEYRIQVQEAATGKQLLSYDVMGLSCDQALTNFLEQRRLG